MIEDDHEVSASGAKVSDTSDLPSQFASATRGDAGAPGYDGLHFACAPTFADDIRGTGEDNDDVDVAGLEPASSSAVPVRVGKTLAGAPRGQDLARVPL